MNLDWKNLPSLSALRAFEAAARLSNFSRAGRSLNVTHAAIAQQVRLLEADIGAPLARRSGRGIALTQTGERLAQSLREGFQIVAEGVDNARNSERVRGLRVTTTPHIVDSIILPKLSEFWRTHPGVEVALMPSPHSVDIVADEFDLAVRVGAGDWPGMASTFLTETKIIAVAAPSLAKNGKLDPAKIPWVMSGESTWIERLLRDVGVISEEMVRVDPGNPLFEIDAVRQGLGATLVTEIVVRSDLAAQRLVKIPTPDLGAARYFAVTPLGTQRRAVSDFIKWLEAIF